MLKVFVTVNDLSKLTAGKTCKLPLGVTAKGAAANARPTALTLSLKVLK